jgi:hypothetical protein
LVASALVRLEALFDAFIKKSLKTPDVSPGMKATTIKFFLIECHGREPVGIYKLTRNFFGAIWAFLNMVSMRNRAILFQVGTLRVHFYYFDVFTRDLLPCTTVALKLQLSYAQ